MGPKTRNEAVRSHGINKSTQKQSQTKPIQSRYVIENSYAKAKRSHFEAKDSYRLKPTTPFSEVHCLVSRTFWSAAACRRFRTAGADPGGTR